MALTELVISVAAVVGFIALMVWYFGIVPKTVTLFLGPKNKRDLAAWELRVETLLQEHVLACTRKASLESELFEMLGSMPATFVHPVEDGIRFGHAYELALKRRAIELGLYAVPEEPSRSAEVIPLASGASSLEWDGGRLVPRRPR